MKHSSRRTKSVLQRRENLWTDSSSENDEKKVKFETFDTSNDESPSPCCLICSILPNLSNINTCPKHLQLVHRSPVRPPQVVYMMHPPIRHCRCSRKTKHRCRSISSSSSSSESEYRHQRKKRSMTIESSSSVRLISCHVYLNFDCSRMRVVKMNNSFLRFFNLKLDLNE